jgi:hypothetical protein
MNSAKRASNQAAATSQPSFIIFRGNLGPRQGAKPAFQREFLGI